MTIRLLCRCRLRSAACALLLAGAVHATPDAELADLSARMQFAFYAGDARSLQQDVAALERLEVVAELTATKRYQLGYGYWKLADVLARTDKPAAGEAAASCTARLDEVLKVQPESADARALHAACNDQLRMLRALRAPLYAAKVDKDLQAALQLAPRNPRVLLIDALISQARAGAAEREQSYRKLLAAAAAFDAAPLPVAGGPDWGHAEALAHLGQEQLARGDSLSARNTLERALILAPDYRVARDLLAKVTAR